MGLGQLIARALPRPEAPRRPVVEFEMRTAGTTLEELLVAEFTRYGQLPMTQYRGAMQVPGAWRASTLLSDIIGGLPWDAYRKSRGRPVEWIEPKPEILAQPNPPDIAMTTYSSLALDLIYHGNGVGLVSSRNAEGWPRAFYAIPADQVNVERLTPMGFGTLPIGPIRYTIGGTVVDTADVIHIKGPCPPGALRGMGVLEAHLTTIRLAKEQLNQATSVANHGVPTGLLKSDNPDLTDTEAANLKTAWLTAQANRTIAVLNATTSFETLAWNPEEMQLVEARKFTNSELSLIFGVPASWLNVDVSTKNYQNVTQDEMNMLRYSVGGHLSRFEGTLTAHMPRGTYAKADLNARLRPDTETRYKTHKTGIDAGFLLPNEARVSEDLPPIAGLDDKVLKPEPAPPPIKATAEVGEPTPELESGEEES